MAGMFVIGALVGIVIGLASGLLGIGGGMLMVPVFRLAWGMSAVASTATSLFVIIPTSVSGIATHLRNRTCVGWLGVAMGIGGALTSPLGVWLAQVVPSWVIMAAAAVVIVYSAFTMLKKALALKPAAPAAPAASAGPTSVASAASASFAPAPGSDLVPPERTGKHIAQAAGIGAAAGIVSGFVGVGGGFIMVPMMLSLLKMPMKLASGTSLVAIMILAIPAVIEQCLLGNVNYLVGVAFACGSIPGAVMGARFVKRVPERQLRFGFAAFLAVAALSLVAKETGLLG